MSDFRKLGHILLMMHDSRWHAISGLWLLHGVTAGGNIISVAFNATVGGNIIFVALIDTCFVVSIPSAITIRVYMYAVFIKTVFK